MLFYTQPMCIFCENRRSERYIILSVGGIGVCKYCYPKIPFAAKNSSFRSFGKASAFSYLISPFFYDGIFRKAILEYKFRGSYAYADVFVELMKDRIDAEYFAKFDMMVPVPLSKRRMTERGYNQSALIAKPMAEFLSIEYNDSVLRRVVNTKKQSLLPRTERRMNVQNAFEADDVSGKRIIVFDDIYTTGYTINECAMTLKRAGAAEVIGFTLSIAPKPLQDDDSHIIRIF